VLLPEVPAPLLCPDMEGPLSPPGLPALIPVPPAPVPDVPVPRCELSPPASPGPVIRAPERMPVPAVPVEPPLFGETSLLRPVGVEPLLGSRAVPPPVPVELAPLALEPAPVVPVPCAWTANAAPIRKIPVTAVARNCLENLASDRAAKPASRLRPTASREGGR